MNNSRNPLDENANKCVTRALKQNPNFFPQSERSLSGMFSITTTDIGFDRKR